MIEAETGGRAPIVPVEPERFGALVIGRDDPVAERFALEAVSHLKGRTIDQVTLVDGADAIRRQSGRAVVIVLVDAAADQVALDTLGAVDAHAATRGWPVVVSVHRDQIDVASAAFVGPHVQLLCDPTAGDWIGAIACSAIGARDELDDQLRENEAARLAKLNQEVARIAEVLARLTRRPDDGYEAQRAEDRRLGFVPNAPPFDITAQEVRDAIRARRMRDRHFGAGLFEDPAWDMMLDLLAAHLERAQVSVSSLCIASAVAPTTALRWIKRMTDEGLFERAADPFDKRRAYIALSAKSIEGMRGYIAALRDARLPLL